MLGRLICKINFLEIRTFKTSITFLCPIIKKSSIKEPDESKGAETPPEEPMAKPKTRAEKMSALGLSQELKPQKREPCLFCEKTLPSAR